MGALQTAYNVLKSGQLWHNTNPKGKCQGYGDANPGEAAKIDTFVAALDAGNFAAAPPVLLTLTGKGIVGMLEALAVQIRPCPPVKFSVSIVGTAKQGSQLVGVIQ